MTTRLAVLSTAILITASSVHSQGVDIDWSQSFGGPVYDSRVAVAVDGAGNIFVTSTMQGTVDFGGGPLTSAGSDDFFVVKLDPTGAFVWSARFGGPNEEETPRIGADAAGNVFVAGYFSGTVDFGGGPLTSDGLDDIFVLSLDATGAHRWSRRFGTAQGDRALGVAVGGAGNVDVTGYFNGVVDFGGGPLPGPTSSYSLSGFVLQLDGSGSYQWSTAMLGEWWLSWACTAVAVDPAGNVYVAGNLKDCDLYCFPSAFVRKYTPGGALLWEKSQGGYPSVHGSNPRTPQITDIAVNASGQAFVIGQSLGCPQVPQGECGGNVQCYSTDGVVEWNRALPPWLKGIDTDADGNVLISGDFGGTVDFGGGPLITNGFNDIFAVKLLGSTGAHVWSDHFGGANSDFGTDIASAEPGHFVLTGSFFGQTDIDGTPHTSAGYDAVLVLGGGGPAETAVAITQFDASESEGAVLLKSRFRSDLGATAVNVYRAPGSGEFRPARIANVQDVRGDGFEYVDRDVSPGESYRYQIGVTDADGEFLSAIVMVTMAALDARLYPSRPNPFNPSTTIRFSIPASAHVTLIVYDASGRLVRTLVDGVRPQGTHEIAWDGHDDHGVGVSSGVYFCRLQAGKVVESQKLVLLK